MRESGNSAHSGSRRAAYRGWGSHSGSSHSRRSRRTSYRVRLLGGFFLFFVIVVFLPLQFSARRTRQRLEARIVWLQSRVVTLEEEISRLDGKPQKTAVLADATGSSESAESLNTTAAQSVAPPAAAATTAITTTRPPRFFTSYDLAHLAANANLMPSGMRVTVGPDSEITHQLDPKANTLIKGFSLLAGRDDQAAAVAFAEMLQSYTNWPYGHFYLAIASKSRVEMEQAADLLLELEKEPQAALETRLYHVLSCLMLGNYHEAEVRLMRLLEREINGRDLMLGPLFIPASTPPALRNRLRRINGLPRLHTASGLQ